MLRDALSGLLDQGTPFGRLALAHVLATAGDTLVTISLAGSLFFSISPSEAKGKVLLYLLLTMAPFAVVSPVLGPAIDRSTDARRLMVVLSTGLRAVLAFVMASDLKSLLLFPEAFTMLVLSKLYLVTKGSLVPQIAEAGSSLPGGAAGGMADAPSRASGDSPQPSGQGSRHRRARRAVADTDGGLAVLNSRLGLLASLSAFVAALPAIAVLKLGGAPWVMRLDILVFVAGALSGARLPVPSRRRRSDSAEAGVASTAQVPGEGWEQTGPLHALGPRATTHPEVTLALSAMSVLKGVVGFLTFLLAFELRRMHAATGWYGYVLAGSTLGAIVGVLLVPRARQHLSEQLMLALSVWVVTVAGVLAFLVGGVAIQGALSFALGMAAAFSKPAFDALVQRFVPPSAQGRSFARFETRLQLVWVLGAVVPVASSIPIDAGDMVIAAVAGVAGVFYLTGRRALGMRFTLRS